MDTKNQNNYFNNPVVIILLFVLIGLGVYVIFLKNSNNNGVENKIFETQSIEKVSDINTQPANIFKSKVTEKQTTDTNFELSQNSEYLFSKNFNPNKVKVYGAGIGDLESNINQSTIINQQEYFGWVRTTNGIAYRIANGKVVEIALNELVKKLGIYSESNIIMRFGQADKIDTTSDYYILNTHYISKSYYYIHRGILVTYNEGNLSSIGINITGVY